MHYKADMPDQLIYILAGEINSGKTTAIRNWAEGREHVFGILSPKIIGKRIFQNIATGEQFEMEALANELQCLQIGRYQFSQKAFDKASLILLDSLQKSKGWLVVDEVGPLELQGKGFFKVITEIVANTDINLKKLLVIRTSSLKEMISFFKIKDYKILMLPLEIE